MPTEAPSDPVVDVDVDVDDVARSRRTRLRRQPRPRQSPWGLLAALTLLTMFAVYGVLIGTEPGEYAVGSLYALLGAAAVIPVIKRVGSKQKHPDFSSVALMGLGLRFLGAVARAKTPSDGLVYHKVGTGLAVKFRSFDFVVDTGREVPGTGTLRYLAGLASVVDFDSRFASYVIWTLFAFLGCLAIYVAFTVALPDANHHRFAVLLFCWPSLAYWPSSLGKEGWMMLGIGITTLGAARYFTGRAMAGTVMALVGMTASAMVRPHVAVIEVAAIGAAILLGRATSGSRIKSGAKLLGAMAFLVASAVLAAKAADFFKVDQLGSNLDTVLTDTIDQTSQGGAAFTPVAVRNPVDYPLAVVTVIFRPFLIEARQITNRLAAVEGLVLLLLCLRHGRSLIAVLTKRGRSYFAVYAASYTAVFVFAFSSIGNFGILARQRVQVLPFVLALLCLPVAAPAVSRSAGSRRRPADDR